MSNLQPKNFSLFIFAVFMALISCVVLPSPARGQLWEALPPYNILWPLWSTALSPINAVTGLPDPLITTLNSTTILPVQPAIVWDPSLPYYTFLYNNPYGSGLVYFDLYGLVTSTAWYNFQTWPPSYLTINPLTLQTGYADLISFDPVLFLEFYLPIANTYYLENYGIASLLSVADIIPPELIFTGTWAVPSVTAP